MGFYLKLIWAYVKIGIFGFGGGYAMLSLVEKSVVGPGWISEQMFTDIVAISQMTPGPIGINSRDIYRLRCSRVGGSGVGASPLGIARVCACDACRSASIVLSGSLRFPFHPQAS